MIKSSHTLIHEEVGHHGHPPSASIATWSADDVITASLNWVKAGTHQTNIKELVGSRRLCLDKTLHLNTTKTPAYGCACMRDHNGPQQQVTTSLILIKLHTAMLLFAFWNAPKKIKM